MGWKTNYKNLYNRVYKKLSYRKEGSFDKYLQRRSRKLVLGSSPAALISLAAENGIGYQHEFSKLPLNQQDRVLQAFRNLSTPTQNNVGIGNKTTTQPTSRYINIADIIKDDILKDRCLDLLKRPRNHDRVFREATTILEDRIRKLSGITQNLLPLDLVGKALKPDPTQAILVISDKPSEQEGFYKICSGIVSVFRNTTHHEISDRLSRNDALKLCGFIDSLLLVLDSAKIHQERL